MAFVCRAPTVDQALCWCWSTCQSPDVPSVRDWVKGKTTQVWAPAREKGSEQSEIKSMWTHSILAECFLWGGNTEGLKEVFVSFRLALKEWELGRKGGRDFWADIWAGPMGKGRTESLRLGLGAETSQKRERTGPDENKHWPGARS